MWKRFDRFMQGWYVRNRPTSTIVLAAVGWIIGIMVFMSLIPVLQRFQ